MSKEYKIPIVYQKIAYYNVRAENLQEAVNQALKEFFAEPAEGYLEDSFELDTVIYDDYPGEDYDIDKAIKSLYP